MIAAASEGRRVYLQYLAENSLDERAVLPVVADTPRDRSFVEALASLESDPRRARVIAGALDATTNDLLVLMAELLSRRLSECGLKVPTRIYVGVFPTLTLNAHTIGRSDWNLVLVNTGAFELLEAILPQFLSVTPGMAGDRAKDVARLIERYCQERGLHERGDMVSPRQAGDVGKAGRIFVTACEEFILAHELGHLARGHVGVGTVKMARAELPPIEVAQKSLNQEYEADIWAADALIRAYNAEADSGAASVACGAPLMFLLLSNLIEAWFRREGTLGDTHPPGWQRYVALRYAYAKAGFHPACQVAGSFAGFCHLVGKRLGLDVEHDDAQLMIAAHVGSLVTDGLQTRVPLHRQTSVFASAPEDDLPKQKPFWKSLFR